jgi:hypothetical protein
MPLPLAAIGLGISAVGSLAQVISGETRRVKAKRALENFQRQELKNITEGLRVSTLGAELQTQEAQRRFATSVDALRSGGVRGVVGGLGQQEMQQQRLQQQISADLDRQQVGIDQMAAQDEARIRAMQEQRESAQIAGLGSEMAQGSRMAQAGLGGLASTGLAAYQIQSLTGNGIGKAADAVGSGSQVVDLATGGKATQDLISSQPTRFMETPSGVQDLGKIFQGTEMTAPNFNQKMYPRTSGLTGNVAPVYLDQYNTQGITFTN